MRYLRTTLATNIPPRRWKDKLVRAVLFFVPSANPDFENLFPSVRAWYVEVDDSGAAVREIGVDAAENPILVAPYRRNYGFWTDSNPPFPDDTATETTADRFEQLWSAFDRLAVSRGLGGTTSNARWSGREQ